MDETKRKNCEMMRGMSSSEAADWLLANHPSDGCFYVSKRTWQREEQERLAAHFLKNIPHASGACYEALLSIMALPRFVELIETYLPGENSDRELLKYHLLPTLSKFAKNSASKKIVAHVNGLLK